MLKRFGVAAVVVLVLVVFASYSFAWNKPGHMVSAAIAYESREMPGVMPLPGSPPPQGPCPDTSA